MKLRYTCLLALLLIAGCVDLSAVTTFSQAAPDVAKLDTLTDVYVADIKIKSQWQGIWLPDDPELQAMAGERAGQKIAFDKLHALLVNYMKALGGLSDAKLTDLSAQAKAASGSLASLKLANVLNAPEVTAIGDLVTFVPHDALDMWRQSELGAAIRQNQKPFQAMIATETAIVEKIYLPDFDNTLGAIDSTAARVRAGMQKSDRNRSGDAMRRAALFSFQQNTEETRIMLGNAKKAAQAYIEALKKISQAYNVLVEQSDHLSAATAQQIVPLLSDANKFYADFNSLKI